MNVDRSIASYVDFDSFNICGIIQADSLVLDGEIMQLSKHAKIRIRERTKLSAAELAVMFEKTAYVPLGVEKDTLYVLFYDARSDEYFVARIRGDTVISVLCLWHRLPEQIWKMCGRSKLQAESFFYNRAAVHLRDTLRPTLDVYVGIKRATTQEILVPAELAFRIDRTGHEQQSDSEILECAAIDISRLVVRELHRYKPDWCAEVTLRKRKGDVVRTCEKGVRKLIAFMPLEGVMHQATLYVSCRKDVTRVDLGLVPTVYTTERAAVVGYLHETFEKVMDAIETRLPSALLLQVRYRIELHNDQFNWRVSIPDVSHAIVRHELEQNRPSVF